jgi:hypothetical protein
MSKRIKQCFKDKYEVSHIWAQQKQDRGWCSGHRVFFNGTDIYSYGHHYLLGRIYTKRDGSKYALINNTRASNTTNTHICAAINAVDKLMVWYSVPNPENLRSSENIKYYEDVAINALMRVFTQNSMLHYENSVLKAAAKCCKDLIETIEHCNSFFKLAGVKHIKLDKLTLDTYYDKVVELLNKGNEKALKQKEQQRLNELNILNEYNIQLGFWLKGEDVHLPYLWHSDVETKIRVLNKVVETTRGAEVPLDHAVRLLKKIVSGDVRKGERVGEYTFDAVKKGVIKIGCHEISLDHAKDVLSKYLK